MSEQNPSHRAALASGKPIPTFVAGAIVVRLLLASSLTLAGCGVDSARDTRGDGSGGTGTSGNPSTTGGAGLAPRSSGGTSIGRATGGAAAGGVSAVDPDGSAAEAGVSPMPDASTGGSSGTPNPTILPCNDILPGSGWQRITPPGGLGDSQALALDPFEVGTVITQMHKGGNGAHADTDGFYRSSDCGSTWKRLPPGRNATDAKDADGRVVNIHSGSIVSLIVDPVERGVMYTASNYGPPGIYKSTNGGVDWDQVVPADLQPYMLYGGWFNALSVDPTDRLHLVASTHTGCTGPFAPNCLAETWDGGEHWRLVPAPPSDNEQAGIYIHDRSTMMYASGQLGAWVTTNDGPGNATPTWTKISQGANGADTGLQAHRASDGKYYVASDYGVLIGSPDFRSWTLDTESPRPMTFIVGTGQNLFASSRASLISTAKEATPRTWSALNAPGNAPPIPGRWLVYEATHHVLYSSMWGDKENDGVYRLATP